KVGGGDGPTSYPSIDDHNIHARSANIASSVEFGLPSEIVTAVEIVDGRLTGLYRSQALHQAKTPPKGNFSSTRLFTKAPSDHSNRVRSFAVASLCFTQKCQVSARFDFDFFLSKRSSPESQEGPLPFFKAKASPFWSLKPLCLPQGPILLKTPLFGGSKTKIFANLCVVCCNLYCNPKNQRQTHSRKPIPRGSHYADSKPSLYCPVGGGEKHPRWKGE
ncbi:hypothetical protein AVEN_257472-1, partial [Araneus ventricosus]